jgi:hypothetical protein
MALKISNVTVVNDSKVGILEGINISSSGVTIATTIPITITQGAIGDSTLFTFATGTYKSAEVTLQIIQGSNYEITKFMVISNGSGLYLEEYGRIGVSATVTISASVATNIVTVKATSTGTAATLKGYYTLIVA